MPRMYVSFGALTFLEQELQAMGCSRVIEWCELNGLDSGHVCEKYWQRFLLMEKSLSETPSPRLDWQLDEVWELIEVLELYLLIKEETE